MMIYRRELKKNAKALIIWSLVLFGIILMTLSIYPQFSANQETMNDLLSAYPDSFKQAFGMDRLDLGTVIGFYGMEIHLMTTLLGSIYAVMLGANMIAKEENEKTIEFLLSKPITRTRIVGEKLAAVVTNIVLFNVVILTACLIGFQFGDDAVAVKPFTVLLLATLLLHLTFGAIALLLSAVMKKSRTITSVSLGLVLMSYFLSVVAGISEDFEMLKYFSFFKYVDAADLISDNAMKPLNLIIMLIVFGLCLALTFLIYRKKDIAT